MFGSGDFKIYQVEGNWLIGSGRTIDGFCLYDVHEVSICKQDYKK